MNNLIDRLSFKSKLIALVILVTLIGILSTLMISYMSSKNSLILMADDQLDSIASISKKRSLDFIQRTDTFTGLLGKDRLTEGLLLAYESAFYGAGKSIGKDEKLDSSSFKKMAEQYKEKVSKQIESYQVAKYLLANINGQIVFSSMFETDGKFAGRNVLQGAFKNLQIAKCTDLALKSKTDEVFFVDTEFNPVVNDTGTYFCTKVVAEFDHLAEGIKKGDLMGAVIVEFDNHRVSELLLERAGMGETGQAYILGEDGLLRSDMFINRSTYNLNNSFEKKLTIESELVKAAKEKSEGKLTFTNVNNKEVLARFRTVDVNGKKWIVVAEKELNEVLKPVNEFLTKVIIISLIVIAVLVILGVYISNKLTHSIIESIETLRAVSDELNNDSVELSATAASLTTTAENQSRDLQSTVQAIDEITSTIDQNTNSAKNSATVSESSLNVVEKGQGVVKQMIQAVNDINESNEVLLKGVESTNMKLSEIVNMISEIESKTKVINDIVFQTKLLSFNASVESARAGEHGKGFAVVAEEVGNLATLSGDSSKSISELLQQSIQRVNQIINETKNEISSVTLESEAKIREGQTKAKECGEVFEKIMDDVRKVSSLVGDISVASTEQSVGINEINKAMNRLSEGTTRSTSAASQSKDAAGKLNSRSDSLRDLVGILHRAMHGNSR